MPTVSDADVYVTAYVPSAYDDWTALTETAKQAWLNVAARELSARFEGYTIPDAAVCEFAAALSVAYNDVNRFARQGVKSLNSKGTSFTFESTGGDYWRHIPQAATWAINSDPANADLPKVSAGRRIKTTIIG